MKMFKSKTEAVTELLKGIDKAQGLHRRSVADIKSNLEKFSFKEHQFSKLGIASKKQKESAVLIILRYNEATDGNWDVLLTLRPQHMRFHPGLTCLPGGKQEPGEDSITCALRESHEELGIDRDDIEVVGALPPSLTIGNITCVPVVAILKDDSKTLNISTNKREVDDYFWVPLYSFVKSGDHRAIKMELKGGFVIDGHYYDYQCEDSGHMYTVWGLTARILLLLSCLAYNRVPEFYEYHAPGASEIDLLYMGYLPSTMLTSKL